MILSQIRHLGETKHKRIKKKKWVKNITVLSGLTFANLWFDL